MVRVLAFSLSELQAFKEKGTSCDLHFKKFILVAVLGKSMKLLITLLFLFLGLRVSLHPLFLVDRRLLYDAIGGWAFLGERFLVIIAVRKKSKNNGR